MGINTLRIPDINLQVLTALVVSNLILFGTNTLFQNEASNYNLLAYDGISRERVLDVLAGLPVPIPTLPILAILALLTLMTIPFYYVQQKRFELRTRVMHVIGNHGVGGDWK